jgi:hypothetical protein
MHDEDGLGYWLGSGKEDQMTEHPGEDFTGGELDEPLVDDLIDETRGPEEDRPERAPDTTPTTPEPPD